MTVRRGKARTAVSIHGYAYVHFDDVGVVCMSGELSCNERCLSTIALLPNQLVASSSSQQHHQCNLDISELKRLISIMVPDNPIYDNNLLHTRNRCLLPQI